MSIRFTGGRSLALVAALFVLIPAAPNVALAQKKKEPQPPGTVSPQVCAQGAPGGVTVQVVCGDDIPPDVTITPGTSTVSSGTVNVTIDWCDNSTLSTSTRRVKLNGQTVTTGYTPSSQAGCGAHGRSTATLTLAQGMNSVQASISDNNANSGSSTVTYTWSQSTYTVVVTPDAQAVQVAPGGSATQVFTLQNTGNAASTYSITASCSGTATGCSASAASVSIAAGASVNLNVTYSVGALGSTGQILLAATSTANASFADQGSVNVTARPMIDVSSDGIVAANSYGATTRTVQPFAVRNSTSSTASYVLSTTCSGAVLPGTCRVTFDTLVVRAGETGRAYVAFETSLAGGTTQVTLTARNGGVQGSGTVSVAVAAEPVLTVVGSEAGATIEKDQCLAFAILRGIANQCGVLRITHALPSVKTLGKSRTPTLLYYADQADPRIALATRINLRGMQVPGSVRVTVWERKPDGSLSALADPKTVNGFFWSANPRHQVSVAVAPGPTSRIVPYRVTAEFLGTSIPQAIVDGEFSVVGRSGSPFGVGWWLAGLEQLLPGQPGGRILWVGGDGSTRAYSQVSTGLWAAPAVDRPDTLKQLATGEYVRLLPHGLKVYYSSLGRHDSTVNRLKHTTRFVYSTPTSTVLDSIAVPPAKAGLGYYFHYSDGRLDRVEAPDTVGKAITTLTPSQTNPGAVARITDPDLTHVDFEFYQGNGVVGVVSARTNRRGVKTSFTMETSVRTMQDAVTPLGLGQQIQHSFRTAAAMGAAPIANPIIADSAITLYDGPRDNATDTVDVTRFWLNAFGAPTKVMNARGEAATIEHGDSRWPALVTRSTLVNGYSERAAFDDRGRATSVTEENPLGGATPRNPTTWFEWHPTLDVVVKATSPTGVMTSAAFDESNENVIWRQTGTDIGRRTSMFYYDTGVVAGLLRASELPKDARLRVARDSVAYNNTVANVSLTRTSGGYLTLYRYNSIGQATRVRRQISKADTSLWREDIIENERMGFVRHTHTIGDPIPGGHVQQWLEVSNSHDDEGQLTSVQRRSLSPYTNIGWVETRFEYDSAGRQVSELPPDAAVNGKDSTGYDPAGNVTKAYTRRNGMSRPIVMTFDGLNRLKTRTTPAVSYGTRLDGVASLKPSEPLYPRYTSAGGTFTLPAETQSFTYDESGAVKTADGSDAQVTRTYFPNGLLKSEELRVRETLTSALSHIYLTSYQYDDEGRRVGLTYPAQLSPGGSVKTAQYYYDQTTGAITTINDVQNNTYTYGYDLRGQVTSLALPGGLNQHWSYDVEGPLAGDSLINQTPSSVVNRFTVPYLRAATFTNGASGERLSMTNTAGNQDVQQMAYSGLGMLAASSYVAHGVNPAGNSVSTSSSDVMQHDALGNLMTDSRGQTDNVFAAGLGPWNSWSTSNETYFYNPSTGRMAKRVAYGVLDTTYYNAAGDVLFQSTGASNGARDRASYYDGAGRLRAADFRSSRNPVYDFTPYRSTFEEYRYDALGRRIWVRSRRWCAYIMDQMSGRYKRNGECRVSFVRRTVWDGNQELGEIQMPGADGTPTTQMENDVGALPVQAPLDVDDWSNDPNLFFGRVAYTFGLALDRPLGVTRMGYLGDSTGVPKSFPDETIIPHWNSRGQPESGSLADGARTHCQAMASGTPYCYKLDWPEGWYPYDRPFFIRTVWHGSLLEDKEDKTGTVYRRNRSYDPANARFTQEDPIGLAGGLNAYGFANGDPINYADPFGLCVWDLCIGEATGLYLAAGALTAGTVAYMAAHQQETAAAADAVSNTAADVAMGASISWEEVKKGVGRAIRIGLVVIGTAASQGKVARDVQKAKIEAERLRKEQEKERRRKKKDEDAGRGSSA